MKALIFAAGLGTRLKPFTLHHPKALVPVGGIPMLRRVIDRISAIGSIDSIVINVHHFSGQVIGYINSHRHEIPVEIHISDESGRLLDTGGGILNARHLLDDGQPFLVHNADILSDINLESMISCHVKSGAAATLLAADRATSRYFLFDSNTLRLQGWRNISTGEILPSGLDTSSLTPLAFGGIHVLSPEIFPALENFNDNGKFSITPFYIQNAEMLDIRAYAPEFSTYNWIDIGKPESLEAAQASTMAKLTGIDGTRI